jgi:nucleotide-binding universal stress UspA family protein
MKEEAMFKRIVVGTDGSDTANAAVALAIELARQSGASLHAVYAFRVRSGAGPGGVAAPASDESLSTSLTQEAAQELLEKVAAQAPDLKVERHCLTGAAADVVVKVAEDEEADLIVVGSKGMQGARRILGSVPNSVAHNAPCHVLIAKTT